MMNKTQKETEDAILKLLNALIENALSNDAISMALGFQALSSWIKTGAHFDESYIEQLRTFSSVKTDSIKN